MGKRKVWLITAAFLVCLFGMAGCKKKQSTLSAELTTLQVTKSEGEITETPTTVATPSPSATVELPIQDKDLHEGMVQSYLTGEWIPKDIANQRPFACMLSNIINANPQSGIGDASILYEALVEGGITRMMGIFENLNPESETAKRIGSVRSARHYYVSFADEYDAIFAHYGQTTYATQKIKALGIDTVSGMAGPGVNAYYRDNTIKKPHNAFLSLEGYQKAVEKAGYRTTYEDEYEAHYKFYEEDTDLQGESASNIKINYSKQITPVLKYDEQSKLYLRYQYNGEHIDYNTKKQLKFKNVIIQFVKEWDIDKNGYQTMDLENVNGEGYYITNGKMIKITWKKNESKRFMRYYDSDGNELTINPGKTYISIFPNNRITDVVIE